MLQPYSPEAVTALTQAATLWCQPGCNPLVPNQAAIIWCPRLQPSLVPKQARATAEAALQQLSHALRALRATWAGALPAALSQQLLGALVDAPVRHVVDACLALRHVSEARHSP